MADQWASLQPQRALAHFAAVFPPSLQEYFLQCSRQNVIASAGFMHMADAPQSSGSAILIAQQRSQRGWVHARRTLPAIISGCTRKGCSTAHWGQMTCCGAQAFCTAWRHVPIWRAHARTFNHGGVHPVVALHILGRVALYDVIPVVFCEKVFLLCRARPLSRSLSWLYLIVPLVLLLLDLLTGRGQGPSKNGGLNCSGGCTLKVYMLMSTHSFRAPGTQLRSTHQGT